LRNNSQILLILAINDVKGEGHGVGMDLHLHWALFPSTCWVVIFQLTYTLCFRYWKLDVRLILKMTAGLI